MDNIKLIEILQATIDPVIRKQAEEQLVQVKKINGFVPTLLHVVMANEVPMPVRQAGVIYLKNLVSSSWQKNNNDKGEPVSFTFHEQDRALIRDSIVDAIIQSQNIIRVQLVLCLKTIIKHDFPARWTQFVDKMLINLQSSDSNCWQGALLCLYQLIINYESSSADERKPLKEAMDHFLPTMYNLIVQLQEGEQNEQCVVVQKQILKNFYCLINLRKINLLREITTREMFSNWMEILRRTLLQPVPEHTLQVEEDKRVHLPWWKVKKWAAYSLYRTFERYGSPVSVREENVLFSVWYVSTFTGGILEAMLEILNQHRQKVYVTPIVLQMVLDYIYQCVMHSYSWKLLKPYMSSVIQDVLFPLMCYSDADEELWKTDPNEFIRLKYDILVGDYVSPIAAAQNLLRACCRKRKCMLEYTMQICMQSLTSQGGEYNPKQRDGAYHVIGTLNEVLTKHKLYKEQIDSLLCQHVINEVNSPSGLIRARTYWMLQCYAGIKFKNNQLLQTICMCTINSILSDAELPVKVEAAIALQMLLTSQEEVQCFLEPHVKEVTLVLLNLIRETEIDNLANILQKIVPLYTDMLLPLSVEIIEHLSTTFLKIIETGAESDKKAMAAMGLFDTIETVLNVMEHNSEIMAQLEKILLRVVVYIIDNKLIEFYEEAMVLLFYPTSESISEDSWKFLEIMYQNFDQYGFDYFPEMVPVLHNFITVDTEAFLSNKNYVMAIFNMSKAVLTLNSEQHSEMCAAKMLEVMVLQCSGKIDDYLFSCVELVLNRMSRKVETSELRTMLLQVLIAILYYNPQLLFTILARIEERVPNASITQHFLKQWIRDRHCFTGIHDRKLYILGICKLLEMGSVRPNINEIIPKLIPFCLVLFDGLRRAYKAFAAAKCDEESSSEEDNDDEADEEVLSSDEDDLKDLSNEHLANLARLAVKRSASEDSLVDSVEGDNDDDYDINDCDPDDGINEFLTPLDVKDCPIDEYVIFKDCLSNLTKTEPCLYNAMISVLSPSQHEALNAIFVIADQRKALQESKLIAQSGGYSFSGTAELLTKFKFGA